MLLNTLEAAAYLSVAEQTLRTWRISGAGPRFVRLGRLVRYRREDLVAFLERNVFSNTAEADGR